MLLDGFDFLPLLNLTILISRAAGSFVGVIRIIVMMKVGVIENGISFLL